MPKPAFKIEHHDAIPVIFQKRKLQKLIVAVPLLIAMALIPLKHNKEYLSKSDMGMWEALIQTAPAAPLQTQEQNVAEYTANAATTKTEQFRYFMIGGSFKSDENAKKYIRQIKVQGYDGQDLGIYGGLHRVAMKGFVNIEEAQKEVNSYLYQNPQSGVWIHVSE